MHATVGGFEMKNATEMVSKAAPEVTLDGGFTWCVTLLPTLEEESKRYWPIIPVKTLVKELLQ
eukprot:803326-Pelagomonas_calceolata.AAC.2